MGGVDGTRAGPRGQSKGSQLEFVQPHLAFPGKCQPLPSRLLRAEAPPATATRMNSELLPLETDG